MAALAEKEAECSELLRRNQELFAQLADLKTQLDAAKAGEVKAASSLAETQTQVFALLVSCLGLRRVLSSRA